MEDSYKWDYYPLPLGPTIAREATAEHAVQAIAAKMFETDPTGAFRYLQKNSDFQGFKGGSGVPHMVSNLLIGRFGQRAGQFVKEHPWTSDIVRTIVSAESTRMQRHRARIKLVAHFWQQPNGAMYREMVFTKPPATACRWCTQVFQPKCHPKNIYCSSSCRTQAWRFRNRERSLANGKHEFLPGLEERLKASRDRSFRQRPTRRRNALARKQAALGLPDW